MLKVESVSVAGATIKFVCHMPKKVNTWIHGFHKPANFKVRVTDDSGTVVGSKEFGEDEITWNIPKRERVKKERVVLGCKPMMVSLDPITVVAARELGGGNLSLGLRMAVERATGGDATATADAQQQKPPAD